MEGDVIESANVDSDERGQPAVAMRMNGEGTRKWKSITTNNVGQRVAVVLDNYVYSAPSINEPIPSGNSQISGNFTVEEATDLVNVLKAGRLPAPTRIVEEAVVGPTLGQESINQGMLSIIAGFVAIVLFMVLYYNNAGLVANLAVLLNIFLIMGIMASMGFILTLPGIAGIVLTIGMAVDANVLINERIKEELRAGNPMRVAIEKGYAAASVTIWDANMTVAIAGIVLFFFGSGPVQGFALTLLIGIVTSLFTSTYVTRLFAHWAMQRNWNFRLTTPLSRGLFQNPAFNFIAHRKKAYIFSTVLILAGLVSLFTRGLDYGVDFRGGWSFVVQSNQPASTVDVRTALGPSLGGEPEVKVYGSADKLKITTDYLIASEDPAAGEQVQGKVQEGLNKLSGNKFTVLGVSKVGPTIADDIKRDALLAVAIALLGIFAYIWVRFRKWEYATGAVIAVFHDSLVVLSAFTLLKDLMPFALEIDQNFIAAVLTIVGYSVNDTVVIFDRIRENTGNKIDDVKDLEGMVNKSLNDTLSRSIVTAFTVFLVVSLLLVFGGQVLRGMSFALLIGIVSGSYSTLYIAVPFLVDALNLKRKRQAGNVLATVPAATSTTTSKVSGKLSTK